MRTLEYQPALDGLRGIAVGSVFLFHQPNDPSLLRGGFLGVDIFFVLSGYLITSLLLAEHARSGTVVSRAFWARRARRLLPALGVFFVLVAIYSVWFAQPFERGALRDGGIAVLLYVYNWWQQFWASSIPNTYSHMWSLAVEEQFYIVWPFLLAAALAVGRRSRRTAMLVVTLLIAGSVGVMAWRYAGGHVVGAYELTDARAHSLLVGALLALVCFDRKVRGGWLLELAGIASAAAIVWLLFTASSDDAWLFHGGYLAVAGAVAVVILAATRPESVVLGRVFGFKPLVWLGLISYGVYLFHPPLDAMLSTAHTGLSVWAVDLVHVVATLAVACASYFLVERPVRYGRFRVRWPVGVVAGLATFGLLLASTVGARPVEATDRLVSRFERLAQTHRTRVLVLGDAFAGSLQDADYGSIRGVSATAFGCGIDPAPILLGDELVPPGDCAARFDREVALGQKFKPAVTVLVPGADALFDRVVSGHAVRVGSPAYQAHLDTVLDRFRAPRMIATVPCMQPGAGGNFARFTQVERDPARVIATNRALRSYAARRHVPIVDLDAVLCVAGHRRFGVTALNGIGVSPLGARLAWAAIARAVR